ncbi:sigma-70 family RNA polymerase sigma factor [Chitinophaga sp. YIM B06452]|uniref:RNA polymerase sigma factor n=1 Tax=Chitinophaga sp. YIM B06452 TaxID=3082158 RepID=UPI0031FEB5F0
MQRPESDFEAIFRETKEFLYGYIRKFVESDADAKDILQQCYIRLWMKMEDVKDTGNILPLLYTYSRNMIIDATRKRAAEKKKMREYTYLSGDAVDSLPAPEDGTAWEKLKHALLLIPEKKRMIFLLRREKGLSTSEIAAQLNITPRAVRKHLEEAVLLLRMHLSSAELFTLIVLGAAVQDISTL